MILLVASTKDIASLNIKRQMLSHHSFQENSEVFHESSVFKTQISNKQIELVTLNEESVHAQYLTESFTDVELVVFISRHSSSSGKPTLSVHTPGNLGEAELGGIPRKVSVSPANAMRNALRAMMHLRDEMRLEYDVSYECTHHGPSLDAPTMFAELGSSPEQWNDLKAAEAVARAVMETISKPKDSNASAAVGIGGPHYNTKFTQMAIDGEKTFGHMIPKYALPYIDSEVLRQCVARTFEKVESIVLDWKGIKGEDKPALLENLKAIELPIEKV
jgi:D-aminoacyl-tRNA deacylase